MNSARSDTSASANIAIAPDPASARSSTAPCKCGCDERRWEINAPVPPPTSSTARTPSSSSDSPIMTACRRAPAAIASWNARAASGCAARYAKKSTPWLATIGSVPSRTAPTICAYDAIAHGDPIIRTHPLHPPSRMSSRVTRLAE